ncbi:hypothetical protein LTR27_010005 [Elasticomyces elasticus]|nr:hypothetical protein LTR27_010005 [Elasticomyces elasticus]
MDANTDPPQVPEQGTSPLMGVKAEPDQDMKQPMPLAATPQQSSEPATEAIPEPAVGEIVLAPRRSGDVTIVLSNNSHVRVSSAVLSQLSEEFDWKLDQAPRRTGGLRVLEFPDDDPEAMVMLLRTAHLDNMLDAGLTTVALIAMKLAKVSAVAAKYHCGSKVSIAAHALMYKGIIAMSLSSHDPDLTMRTYGQYSAAAYNLGMSITFSHYTRRLVLDTTTSFTEIREIEGCSTLPIGVILGLEEQRSALREELIATITARTNGKCQTSGCTHSSPSSSFASHATRRLSVPHWPPPWSSTTLRNLLRKLMHTGDISLGHTFPTCLHKNNPSVISQTALTTICRAVDKHARGLCLTCARDDKSQSRCEHAEKIVKDQLKDWIV